MADAKNATIQVDVKMPNPFVRMLYSRKVWVSIIGLVAVALADYSGLSLEMRQQIIMVCLTLVGSMALEDAAEKSAPTTVTAGGDATVTNVEQTPNP
jgi:hypothetical protein